MKIIVLGAGAIGSLYGARLSKLNDVTLVARREHAEKINKNGLKITGEENKVYKLKATTEINEIEDDEFFGNDCSDNCYGVNQWTHISLVSSQGNWFAYFNALSIFFFVNSKFLNAFLSSSKHGYATGCGFIKIFRFFLTAKLLRNLRLSRNS